MGFPRFAKVIKAALNAVIGIVLVLLVSLFYANKIEPNWIDVVSVRLTLPHLAPEFQGYRIVQISDIHVDSWMSQQRLKKIVARVNQQQPDLVAITGDFVTYIPKDFVRRMTVTFSQLKPQDLTVAVLGNHDHWTDAKVIRRVLNQSGVVDISNAVRTIRRKDAVLHIAGVDDFWVRKDRLDLVLKQLPGKDSAILLAHEPDFAEISSATGRFDLLLSGHSHGGQISIPFLGPPKLPPYGQKYPVGLYQIGEMLQYTNRGVGMVKPRVRFNCRPEITVFTLETVKS